MSEPTKAIISVDSETFKKIAYPADQANRTASGAKIITEMKKIFDAIRMASEGGSFAMEFPEGVLTEDYRTILTYLGYKLSMKESEDVVAW
jgi:hypothetical protein